MPRSARPIGNSPVPPLDLASGDLLADRRADYAEMLLGVGDLDAAAEVMLSALELAPGWVLGWFRLGEMRERAGVLDQAAEAWRMALNLDPADRCGAGLKLELIGRAPPSAAPPSPFVEALFDQYAPTFDAALVDGLGYRVPALIEQILTDTGRSFRRALDLGCGTGLMGARLRALTRTLEGVDLSAAMLRRAELRAVYDRLEKADLTLFSPPAGAFDLVVAADVFTYLGALEAVIARIAAALAEGGLFVFSVERHDGAEPFRLRASRRYAHSQAGLRDALEAAGLARTVIREETIRMDRGAPVAGLIVRAERGRAG